MNLRKQLSSYMALNNYVEAVREGTDSVQLTDAITNSLSYVKVFGGTEQRNLPSGYTQVNYVTNVVQTQVNTGIMLDFTKNYEFEIQCSAVTGSWYMMQSRVASTSNITGISGSQSGDTILLVIGGVSVCTSSITRTTGNKLYVKATLNNGVATLYVKDETDGIEDTQTGSYDTTQESPTVPIYLLGNAASQYVNVNTDVYIARIKENGVTVMDYVPARQSTTAGFYDKASGTFKTALTPGNLVADGDTVPTPDTPMDIVCNNGVLKLSPNLMKVDSNTVKLGYYISASTGAETANDANFLIDTYIPIKPDTSYVAYGRRKTDNILSAWNRIAWYDSNKTYIDTSPYTQNTIGLGTSPSNAAYARFSSDPITDVLTMSDVESFNWTFREGTQEYTGFIPYGDIIVEGTPETITITGKNLYDVSKDTDGKYIDENGNIDDENRSCYSDLIPVKPGESYTYSGICKSTSGTYNNKRIHGYVDGVWNQQIKMIVISINQPFSDTFTIPAGINGIRISHWKDDTYTQFEESPRPTQYEEYYQTSFNPEDLLATGNYQDEQDVISGNVVRKVGIKVFDGTENWIRPADDYADMFYTDACIDAYYGDPRRIAIPCTHLQGTDATDINMQDNQIKLTAQSSALTTPLIYIKSSISNNDLVTWKNWLATQYAAGTPVIVIYPLATETEEVVESRDVFITSGTNTIERNSAYVSGSDITVEYKKLR